MTTVEIENAVTPRQGTVRTVLFVDDEPRILDGLMRAFRRFRDRWRTLSATSGERALALLEHERVDVVVSDMRMPVMDGAAVLARVQARWPAVVRIVLSGQADAESARRALLSAHQYIFKPCDPIILEERFSRILDLRDQLADERIRSATGGLAILPGRLDIMARLQKAASSDASGTHDLADLIEKDIAVTAKLLQTANSAFFGLGRHISRASEAIAYLGIEVVRSLVQAEIIFSSVPPSSEIEAIHHHSTRVAHLAQRLAPSSLANQAFTSGLLQDVGRLVLAQFPNKELTSAPFIARVGAYLLQMWGIPWFIVEAVAMHHEFEQGTSQTVTLSDLLGMAKLLLDPSPASAEQLATSQRLRRLGLLNDLEHWRELARKISM